MIYTRLQLYVIAQYAIGKYSKKLRSLCCYWFEC